MITDLGGDPITVLAWLNVRDGSAAVEIRNGGTIAAFDPHQAIALAQELIGLAETLGDTLRWVGVQ